MNEIKRISTEVIQTISTAQAWEYRLVPYDKKGAILKCYGDSKVDYNNIKQELTVLYDIEASINCIDMLELDILLRTYYRKDAKKGNSKVGTIENIGSGQGFLMNLIEEAFNMHASDIHIESYEQRCRVRFRMDGKLIERYVVEKGNYASLINQIKILANLDISEKRLPQDGRILYNRSGNKFDIRVSSLPSIYGEKIVMRLLTRQIELLELANLGFTEKQLSDYCRCINRPHGMVLICGPTGSGKSTTLYATLRRLNKESRNILTIEDPVEYTLEGVNQVQLKEDIGLTFASALRTFLRQDPDIIMLGEIRDSATAQMAIRSSLTGHLLFSTIHTNSAWGSIARLQDMDLHPYLIGNTLIMCVAQRLIRLLCPHCKQLVTGFDDKMKDFVGSTEKYYEAVGCNECYYTGYIGRRAVYEVIPMDSELSEAARNGVVDIEPMLKQREIVSIRNAAFEMLVSGITSPEELIPLLNS